jgi:Na+-driven multidrug efflux pump
MWFHQPQHLVNLVAPYFRIMALGTLCWMIFVSLTQFLAGTSKPHISFYLSFLSLVWYLIPSYLLVFGHGGFKAMGIPGVAWGSLFCGLCMDLIILSYLFFSSHYREFKIFTLAKKVDWQ